MQKFLFVLNGSVVYFFASIFAIPIMFVLSMIKSILLVPWGIICIFLYPIKLNSLISSQPVEKFGKDKKEEPDNWSLFVIFFKQIIKGAL